MKRGFTIIELVMVVAIMGILLGIVTTAAASSIKQARDRKADACCRVVQAGFETFYSQKGYWPGGIDSKLKGDKANSEGKMYNADADLYVLDPGDVDEMMREILREYKKGNPCLDISGLFVSRNGSPPREERCSKCGGKRYLPARGAMGLDFMTAIRGTKKEQNGQRMKTGEMHFGYPHKENGGFMPFKVTYSKPTDSISVSKWHWE